MARATLVTQGLTGAVVGAGAGYLLLPGLLARFGTRLPEHFLAHPAVLGAAAGCALGVIGAAIAEIRQGARRADLADSAAPLGARYREHDPQISEFLLADFPERSLHLGNVLEKRLPDVRLVIGDLSITTEGREAGDDPTTSTRTAAYHRRDGLVLPRFDVQPAKAMTRLMGRAMGIRGLEFPGNPEFERQYRVISPDVAGTRALLNGPLLSWLARHPGLHVASGGSGMLFYREALLQPHEINAFAAEAVEWCRLVNQAAPIATAPASPQDQIKALAEQVLPPSVADRLVREFKSRLVTRDDAAAFVGQSPPRSIPANIAAYRDEFGPMLVIGVGVLFAATGGAFAYLLQDDWKGVLFALVFVVVGAALAISFGRVRWRVNRILQRGELAAGRIERVERTGWRTNGGHVFNVSARYVSGGRALTGRCKVIGHAGERLLRLASEGKPIAVLRDPAAAERILVVEALVNAES